MIRAFAAAGLALLLAPATGLAQQSTRDHELAARLQPNTTLKRYLDNLRNEFGRTDADGNGIIDESDVAAVRAFAVAQNRALRALMIMRFDIDGDGVVTKAEARRVLSYERRMQSQMRGAIVLQDRGIEAAVRKVMEADADHDDRVTYAELLQSVNSRLQMRWAPIVLHRSNAAKRVLKLAPQGKDTVTFAEIEPDAEALFRTVDTDKDGKISVDEIRTYRAGPVEPSAELRRQAEANAQARERQRRQAASAAQEKIAAEQKRRADAQKKIAAAREAAKDKVRQEKLAAAKRQEKELLAACPMPKPSVAAKVVMLGTQETEALSSVALMSQDAVTGVGTIKVETGKKPLYVVIISQRPTIWRFNGATKRVERVVVRSTQPIHERGSRVPTYAAGVIGLPAERVSFSQDARCLRYFGIAPSNASVEAAVRLKQIIGRMPDVVAAKQDVSAFNVPSGRAKVIGGKLHQVLIVRPGSNGPKIVAVDTRTGKIRALPTTGALKHDLRKSSPGGVIAINAKRVVANVPVSPYKVLPEEAGLIQLVKARALTQTGPNEFVIKKKIRFPAGLVGAHMAKFVLRRGVPKPQGNPGDSKVISEETSEQLKFDSR